MSDKLLLLSLLVAAVLVLLSAVVGAAFATFGSPTLDAATLVPVVALVVLPFAIVVGMIGASRVKE